MKKLKVLLIFILSIQLVQSQDLFQKRIKTTQEGSNIGEIILSSKNKLILLNNVFKTAYLNTSKSEYEILVINTDLSIAARKVIYCDTWLQLFDIAENPGVGYSLIGAAHINGKSGDDILNAIVLNFDYCLSLQSADYIKSPLDDLVGQGLGIVYMDTNRAIIKARVTSLLDDEIDEFAYSGSIIEYFPKEAKLGWNSLIPSIAGAIHFNNNEYLISDYSYFDFTNTGIGYIRSFNAVYAPNGYCKWYYVDSTFYSKSNAMTSFGNNAYYGFGYHRNVGVSAIINKFDSTGKLLKFYEEGNINTNSNRWFINGGMLGDKVYACMQAFNDEIYSVTLLDTNLNKIKMVKIQQNGYTNGSVVFSAVDEKKHYLYIAYRQSPTDSLKRQYIMLQRFDKNLELSNLTKEDSILKVECNNYNSSTIDLNKINFNTLDFVYDPWRSFLNSKKQHPFPNNNENNGIVIYPNPSSNGEFKISCKDNLIQSYEVYDVTGKLIQQRKLAIFQKFLYLNVEPKSSLYLLKIKAGNKVSSHLIKVQN